VIVVRPGMPRIDQLRPGADVIGSRMRQPANALENPSRDAARLDEVPPARQVLREIGTTLALRLGAALIGNLFALAINAATPSSF